LRSFDDGLLQSISHADQLGRVDLVRTSDGSPLSPLGTDGIKVATTYKTSAGGSRVITSSPYRSDGEPGMQWTCTEHDQSGRVTIAAQFRNSAPTDCTATLNRTGATTTDYHVATGAPRLRITDPAGAIVDHYSDPLGRLVTVVEDPFVKAYSTTYEYG